MAADIPSEKPELKDRLPLAQAGSWTMVSRDQTFDI